MSWARASIALGALLSCVGCGEPELSLQMFSTDDVCTSTHNNLRETESVQLAIVAQAGFALDGTLDGCLAARDCYKRGVDFVSAPDLKALAQELEVTGAELRAPVADDLAVIVTGFRNGNCDPTNTADVSLCGQAIVDTFPDSGSTITLLTACSSGTAKALFCNPAQHLSTCP